MINIDSIVCYLQDKGYTEASSIGAQIILQKITGGCSLAVSEANLHALVSAYVAKLEQDRDTAGKEVQEEQEARGTLLIPNHPNLWPDFNSVTPDHPDDARAAGRKSMEELSGLIQAMSGRTSGDTGARTDKR